MTVVLSCSASHSFLAPSRMVSIADSHHSATAMNMKISKERRDQLGIGDDEDEYDLGVALNTNTDPLITKIIAGSFIAAMIVLLVVGLVIPSMTDYGDGVCNPLLTAGRC